MKEQECKALFSSALGRLQSDGASTAWLLFGLDKLHHELFFLRQDEHVRSISLKLKACVCFRQKSWPNGSKLHLTKTHPEMDVVFPSQTRARLRCDHAECVTKMLRSEWHLSPELKTLGSVSINNQNCVSHAHMHARALTARSYAKTARNRNCLVSQTLCVTDEAVELPPERIWGNHHCSVHWFTGAETLEQMVCRRWGPGGPQHCGLTAEPACFRQNLA